MKSTKKVIVPIFLFSILMSHLFLFIKNTDDSKVKNNFVLINAETLAFAECKTGQVTGSKYSFKCNTPKGDDGKCDYKVVTCQGSAGCCTIDLCKDHN